MSRDRRLVATRRGIAVLFIDGILIGMAIGLFARGSLRNLAHVRFKFEVPLLALLVVQVVWPGVAAASGYGRGGFIVPWLAIMGGLLLIALANWRFVGMRVMAIGIAANILVIGLNGAMPVSLRAAEIVAGAEAAADMTWDSLHEPIADETLLPMLADIIPLPGPKWHRGVLSIGDVVLVLGAALVVIRAMRTPEGSQAAAA